MEIEFITSGLVELDLLFAYIIHIINDVRCEENGSVE